MAFGSFLTAIGLLTIPHTASLGELAAALTTGVAEGGRRTVIGLGLIGAGLLSGLFGWILSRGGRAAAA
jgi:hypothetical protein